MVSDSPFQKRRSEKGKSNKKEINLSVSSRNGYKNAQYGSGYIGWPSDSEDDDDSNISLQEIISKKVSKDCHRQVHKKNGSDTKSTKQKKLNVNLFEGEKQKSKSLPVDINSVRGDKRIYIPRSELSVKNLFNTNDIENAGRKGRSYELSDFPLCNSVFANSNENTNRPSESETSANADKTENQQDSNISLMKSSSKNVHSSYSLANQISSPSENYFPATSRSVHSVSTFSHPELDLSSADNLCSLSCVSPQSDNANIGSTSTQKTLLLPDSQTDKSKCDSFPVPCSSDFIRVHQEVTDRPSCRFNSTENNVSFKNTNVQCDSTVDNRDSEPFIDVSQDYKDFAPISVEETPTMRRNPAPTRKKKRPYNPRQRADGTPKQFHNRCDDVITIDDNGEMNDAVSLARQLESDEEMAKRLQEEMDKEFAMSLTGADSGRRNPHHSHFNDSHPTSFPTCHHHSLIPSRHHGYTRQANTRSRRRQPGNDDDFFDRGVIESLFLPLYPREGMDNTFDVTMQARILSLFENPEVRRFRRGGRSFSHLGEGNDYEELLELAENLGDVKSKGINSTEINRLPTRDYKKADGPSEDCEECMICMCEYRSGEKQRILPCFHEFHAKCIDKWLKSNATCPVCRVDVRS